MDVLRRSLPITAASSGSTVTPRPALVPGNSRARLSATDAEIVARRFQRDARLQSSDRVVVVKRPRRCRRLLRKPIPGQGPEARSTEQIGFLGQDADDGVRIAVEANAATDHGRIRIEVGSPERFAQHDHTRPLPDVVLTERSADDWLDAEDVQHAGAQPLPWHGLRRAIGVAHHHAAHVGHKRRHGFERAAALAPVVQIRGRHGAPEQRPGALPQHDEPIGFRKRERPQQGRVHQREDGAVRADTQREGQDGDRGKRALRPEHAHRVAQILPEVARQEASRRSWHDWRRDVGLPKCPHTVGQRGRLEEFFDGKAPSVIGARAASQQLFVALIEVQRKLFDDFRLARRIEVQPRQPRAELLGPVGHIAVIATYGIAAITPTQGLYTIIKSR